MTADWSKLTFKCQNSFQSSQRHYLVGRINLSNSNLKHLGSSNVTSNEVHYPKKAGS